MEKSINEVELVLYWLKDMAIFYDHLEKFVMKLPQDANKKNMIHHHPMINNNSDETNNTDFEKFCKLSDQMSTYNMPPIPSSYKNILTPALKLVQEMSRQAFIKVSLHPAFSDFSFSDEQRPFFEKAMINGSCIAVEHHDIINLNDFSKTSLINNNNMISMLDIQIEKIRNEFIS